MPEQLSLLDAPKEILPLLFPTQQPAPVATLPDPPPTWIDCPPDIEFSRLCVPFLLPPLAVCHSRSGASRWRNLSCIGPHATCR